MYELGSAFDKFIVCQTAAITAAFGPCTEWPSLTQFVSMLCLPAFSDVSPLSPTILLNNRRHLRCAGHVVRMPLTRAPKNLLTCSVLNFLLVMRKNDVLLGAQVVLSELFFYLATYYRQCICPKKSVFWSNALSENVLLRSLQTVHLTQCAFWKCTSTFLTVRFGLKCTLTKTQSAFRFDHWQSSRRGRSMTLQTRLTTSKFG
jgi:hypothetical protein